MSLPTDLEDTKQIMPDSINYGHTCKKIAMISNIFFPKFKKKTIFPIKWSDGFGNQVFLTIPGW